MTERERLVEAEAIMHGLLKLVFDLTGFMVKISAPDDAALQEQASAMVDRVAMYQIDAGEPADPRLWQ